MSHHLGTFQKTYCLYTKISVEQFRKMIEYVESDVVLLTSTIQELTQEKDELNREKTDVQQKLTELEHEKDTIYSKLSKSQKTQYIQNYLHVRTNETYTQEIIDLYQANDPESNQCKVYNTYRLVK